MTSSLPVKGPSTLGVASVPPMVVSAGLVGLVSSSMGSSAGGGGGVWTGKSGCWAPFGYCLLINWLS